MLMYVGMLCWQSTQYTSECLVMQGTFHAQSLFVFRNFDQLIPDAPELVHGYLEQGPVLQEKFHAHSLVVFVCC